MDGVLLLWLSVTRTPYAAPQEVPVNSKLKMLMSAAVFDRGADEFTGTMSLREQVAALSHTLVGCWMVSHASQGVVRCQAQSTSGCLPFHLLLALLDSGM